MPVAGGVIASARTVAARATLRAVGHETPCARMRKMSLPAKRVPSSCDTFGMERHDLKAASAGAAAIARTAAARKARASVLIASADTPCRGGETGASRDEQRDDLPGAEVDDDRVAVDVRRAEIVLEQVRAPRVRERHAEPDERPPAAAVGLVEAQHEGVGVLGELHRVEDEAGRALDRSPRRALAGAPPKRR